MPGGSDLGDCVDVVCDIVVNLGRPVTLTDFVVLSFVLELRHR